LELERDIEVKTLSGLFMEQLGKIPQAGDTIE